MLLKEMTNNKQQTAVDIAELAMKLYPFSNSERNAFIAGYNKAKEMEKEGMIGLLKWMNSVNQSDPMRLETDNDDIVEQYYKETYGI
jgi:hypothetical protein